MSNAFLMILKRRFQLESVFLFSNQLVKTIWGGSRIILLQNMEDSQLLQKVSRLWVKKIRSPYIITSQVGKAPHKATTPKMNVIQLITLRLIKYGRLSPIESIVWIKSNISIQREQMLALSSPPLYLRILIRVHPALLLKFHIVFINSLLIIHWERINEIFRIWQR